MMTSKYVWTWTVGFNVVSPFFPIFHKLFLHIYTFSFQMYSYDIADLETYYLDSISQI